LGLIFAPKSIVYRQEDSLTDDAWRLFIIYGILEGLQPPNTEKLI